MQSFPYLSAKVFSIKCDFDRKLYYWVMTHHQHNTNSLAKEITVRWLLLIFFFFFFETTYLRRPWTRVLQVDYVCDCKGKNGVGRGFLSWQIPFIPLPWAILQEHESAQSNVSSSTEAESRIGQGGRKPDPACQPAVRAQHKNSPLTGRKNFRSESNGISQAFNLCRLPVKCTLLIIFDANYVN